MTYRAIDIEKLDVVFEKHQREGFLDLTEILFTLKPLEPVGDEACPHQWWPSDCELCKEEWEERVAAHAESYETTDHGDSVYPR